jgi:hypothetical protein
VFANINIEVPVPFIYNIPLKPLSNFPDSMVFNVSDCNEWYLYRFNESATDEDREFFGSNTGYPINKPERSGMLGHNMMTTACNTVDRTVPYF